MLRAALVAVTLGMLAGQAAAQTPPRREVPCDARLVVTLDGAKCSQGAQLQSGVDGTAGTGRMMDGHIFFEGKLMGATMSGAILLADRPDMGIVGLRENQVSDYVDRITRQRRIGDLSDLETYGSAWVITYRIQGGDCAWINNYGPAQSVGNAWISQAVLCRESPAGSKPFTREELRPAIAAVKGK
jgi:hypothetical protein